MKPLWFFVVGLWLTSGSVVKASPTTSDKKVCYTPDAPWESTISQTGWDIGNTANITCPPGYQYSGTNPRECQENGTWSGVKGKCYKPGQSCRPFSKQDHGVIVPNSYPGQRPKVKLVCDSGYTHNGSEELVCLDDYEWNGTLGICRAKSNCSALQDPNNGIVTVLRLEDGDIANITCQSGYWYNGTNPRVCQENGTWSGEEGQCQEEDCQLLPEQDHGMVVPTNMTGVIKLECNEGYTIEGPHQVFCLGKNGWNETLGTCIEKARVVCPQPELDKHIIIDYKRYAPEMAIHLSCPNGYSFNGTEYVSCNENGTWSDMMASCTAMVWCPMPEFPKNGGANILGFKVGDKASFTCKPGSRYNGTNPRVCQGDGTWSGVEGQCQLSHPSWQKCQLLSNPDHGYIFPINETMVMKCNEGYVLNGSGEVVCQENNVWNDTLGVCIEKARVYCSIPEFENHIIVDYERDAPETAIHLSCQTGYTFRGTERITCQENGTWTNMMASCKATDDEHSYAAVIVGIVLTVMTISSLSLAAFIIKRRRRDIHKVATTFADPLKILNEANRSTVEKILIEADRVKVHYVLGQELHGHFWLVYFGALRKNADSENEDLVVLMTLKGGLNIHVEMNDFIQRATNMHRFDHPNILQILGVTVVKDHLYVVMPHMEVGDLKTFIQVQQFDQDQSVRLLLDAAKGMEYLADKNFIHRDVAARNCMLDNKLNVYISDIGLARDLHAEDYYKPFDTATPLPLRWMAPEAIQYNHYSTKTDVWAFGVLIWEVLAGGGRPYINDDVRDADLLKFLKGGNRLNKPEQSHPGLFRLARRCWSREPKRRPTFGKLVKRLDGLYTRMNDVEKREVTDVSGGGCNMIDNVLAESMIGYFEMKL